VTIISINIKTLFTTPYFYTGMTHATVFACLELYNEGQKTRYEFFFLISVIMNFKKYCLSVTLTQ